MRLIGGVLLALSEDKGVSKSSPARSDVNGTATGKIERGKLFEG